MKLKNILYRKYNDLSTKEKQFYHLNRDKFEINLCDKNETVHYSKELIWISEDYENLTDEQIKICEKYDWQALSEEALNEIEDYLTFPNMEL